MPAITFPHTFSPGPTSATDVADNLFEPRGTPRTLDVINGQLDSGNLASSNISWRMVRPKTWHRMGTSGATISRDVFEGMYQGSWSVGDRLSDYTASPMVIGYEDMAIPVMGIGKTFDVPFADCSAVYLSWQALLVVDEDLTTEAENNNVTKSVCALYIDGYPVGAQSNYIKTGNRSMAKRAAYNSPYNNSWGYPDLRAWFGHMVVSDKHGAGAYIPVGEPQFLAKGLHTADIRFATKARHVRFHSCRMTAIPLR